MITSVLLLLVTSSLLQGQTHSWTVQNQPATLVNGVPVLFRVTAPQKLASLQGTWLQHGIAFRFAPECKCWYAIAGVPLDTKPAHYVLDLEGEAASGAKMKISRQVAVAEAHYPSTAIKLPPQYVEPPKEMLARIKEEETVKKQVFSETAADPLWNGAFEPPTKTQVSGVFGSKRVVNGATRSQHKGLDFRAHTGTPVYAANAGTVVLARDLYYEGNCVMIDHGQGLLTMYFHLSEFKVKEGEKVKREQLIALSGGTGRSTAPHLHFAVRWQGTYLNPAILLKLTPP